MPRYIGIDHGDKRIGIAISDEDGNFAFPKGIIQNHPSPSSGLQEKKFFQYFFDEIKSITSFELQSFDAIVIGLPQNFHGKDTEQTKKVRAFTEALKTNIDVEIIFENEILTSRQIEKTNASSKAMIDASSAALILQVFLDRRK